MKKLFLKIKKHRDYYVAAWVLAFATAGITLTGMPATTAYAADSVVETVYLDVPKHVWWETDTVGKWSSVSKAHEYQVKLYIADYVDRDEDNWRSIDFNDESMLDAECVMSKRITDTRYDFSQYMDDLHTYFFVVRATPRISEQAYVQAGDWVESPDVDFRQTQTIGITGGKWRNYLEGSRYETEDEIFLGGGWQLIQGTWYLLNDAGYRLSGWQLVDGKYYYLGEAGQMATGWFVWNDRWYYANQDGVMQTGWVMPQPGKYYYLYEDGSLACDTVVDGYQVNGDGLRQ